MENLNRREFMAGVVATLATPSIETAENIEENEFPSSAAIAETVKALLEGREGRIVKKFEDEKGVIACDIEFVLADGETATLEYMRKGRHEVMNESNSLRTNIYVTHFDEGMPVGGTNVAEYNNGQWEIVADMEE
ncbi:MAG: hypothetical protein ACK42D_02610 [Candidatus Paceibacteria bacterium]